MSEIKHTLGPYKPGKRGTAFIVEGGCREVIAVLPSPGNGGYGVVQAGEREANAARIAAALNAMDDPLNKVAPELLEATKEAVFSMEATGEYVGGYNQLRAAIAKAEGRE